MDFYTKFVRPVMAWSGGLAISAPRQITYYDAKNKIHPHPNDHSFTMMTDTCI